MRNCRHWFLTTCLSFRRNDCDIVSDFEQWKKWFSKHQVQLFFPLFSLATFLTGALLDTIYIDCLFCTFRWTTRDGINSFLATVLVEKCFLEWRLALRKTLGSILFKSIQSFSPFILHIMYWVQMIVLFEICHFRSWCILMVCPCRYQPQTWGGTATTNVWSQAASSIPATSTCSDTTAPSCHHS